MDQTTGNEIPLAGVNFQLIKKIAGNEYIIQEGSTKADGTLTFENVRYGTYFIKEVAAPDGHIKMSDEEFILSAGNDILVLENKDKIIKLQNIKINQGI
ncbi:prealbumin-like fold domain-containing protein, partial [Stenotrophomonas maltophilia group sp. RNC7]|uniref:prealbumin-like fold domain-containing protein n=1 Tax=Stenotrophomonas maltophilia group sp. RNC7 TaxID=3071467 RepID=UPI0027DF97FD